MKSCPHCGKELPKVTRINNYTINYNYSTALFEGINGEVDIWKDKYPAIDVVAEIKKAEGWCFNNPKNKKSNWKTFLGKWMARSQDKAPGQGMIGGNDMAKKTAQERLVEVLKDRMGKPTDLTPEANQLFRSMNRNFLDLRRDVQVGKDIFAASAPDVKSAAANDRE